MSADTVIMSAGGPGVRSTPPATPMDQAVHGAIDEMDVTARLEANGLSDRTVQARYGAGDVFTFANTLMQDAARLLPPPQQRAARTDSRREWLESFARAAILLCSAVLGTLVQAQVRAAPLDLVVAGLAGWSCGQATGAIAWRRLGQGEAAEGVRRAWMVGGLAILVATAIALAASAGEPAPMRLVACALTAGWSLYAVCISLLLAGGRAFRMLLFLLPGCVVGLVALRLDLPPVVDGCIAATGPVAVVLLAAVQLRRAGGPRLPTPADVGVATQACAHAAILAMALVIWLGRAGDSHRFDIVIGTVLGAAAADPALVLLRTQLRHSAARVSRVSSATRGAWLVTAVAIAMTTASSAAAAALAGTATGQVEPTCVLLAALFTAGATISVALVALGAPWLACAAAAAIALASLAGTETVGAVLATLVGVLVALVMLLCRTANPRLWL